MFLIFLYTMCVQESSGVGCLVSYLRPDLGDGLKGMSALGLAHIGDAVFELMVRTWLCSQGAVTAKKLHGGAIELVSAKAQALASEVIVPMLCEEELAVFKRGRNARVNTTPRGSSNGEYHAATGVEALFGYLYLSGRRARLDELFSLIIKPTKNSVDK